VELLAEGRTAEVYAYGDGRVVKLDRPEWSGLAPFEGEILERLVEAGLPVARPYGSVSLEGRSGVVLERIDGAPLMAHVAQASPGPRRQLADRFAATQQAVNATRITGLPDLVPRLRGEIEGSIADPGLRRELTDLLDELDDRDRSGRGVCHFDFHPGNVLVEPDRWVVIDWLTVASGPAAADLARTCVLTGRWSAEPFAAFGRDIRRLGLERRGLGADTLNAWVRVVAGARLAEGFGGEEAVWLLRVAQGAERPHT
jgi:Ser/Thr protein kinase RdoA (MazF antagonist)